MTKKEKGETQPPTFYPMRRVPLRGQITRQSAVCCINRMLYLAAESATDPILIEISSPSGLVAESQEIIRVMDSITCPVATFCRGVISGAAVAIAAHGARGFRAASPNCRFVFALGQAGETESVNWLPAKLAGSLVRDTGQNELELGRWLNSRLELNADEALKKGLIDLIESRPVFAQREAA